MDIGLNTKKTQTIGLGLVIFTLFIDTLLYSLIIPIIPNYITRLGASQTVVGLLFGSYAVSLLITSPLWGILSDRVGRRIPIILGLAGFAASTVFFAFADSIPELFIARLLQGIASAATWTSSLALLADLFPSNERGKVMGLALTAISAGSLLGAPMGGFLADLGGYVTPFLTVTVLIIIDGLAFTFLIKDSQKSAEEKTNILVLLRNRKVLLISAIIFVANGILSLLEPIFPIFLEKSFNASITSIGLLFGIATLAHGITAPVSGNLADRYGHFPVMFCGLALIALTIPLLVLSGTLFHEAIAMFLVGASVAAALSPTLSAIANVVDQQETKSYASAYAIFDIFYALAMILGPIAGGILADLLGLRISVLAVSSLLLAAIILSFISYSLKNFRR